MNIRIILVFAIILTFGLVTANDLDNELLLDTVMTDLRQLIDPECFELVKLHLEHDFMEAIEMFLDHLVDGVPVLKGGAEFDLNEYIKNSLLATDTQSINPECIETTKEVYRNYVIDKFGGLVNLKY